MVARDDPRIQAVASILSQGIADLLARCIEAFETPPSSGGSIAPERAAIRRADIPAAVAPTVPERSLPPVLPPIDRPPDPSALRVPTWAQLLNLYAECAAENRRKNLKPSERSQQTNIAGVKKILSRLNISMDEPYTVLTRQRMAKLEEMGLKAGRSRASIQTWRAYVKSVTARWACL